MNWAVILFESNQLTLNFSAMSQIDILSRQSMLINNLDDERKLMKLTQELERLEKSQIHF